LVAEDVAELADEGGLDDHHHPVPAYARHLVRTDQATVLDAVAAGAKLRKRAGILQGVEKEVYRAVAHRVRSDLPP